MAKQRLEKRWKNFVEVAGLWKENESEKMALKMALKNYFEFNDI